jgi:hypothetical protein
MSDNSDEKPPLSLLYTCLANRCHTQYKALSYFLGDAYGQEEILLKKPRNFQSAIDFKVNRNLFAALKQFRNSDRL